MAAPPLNLVSFLQRSGQADGTYSLADQLAFAKKYDPNANIVQNANNTDILNYDQSKLPQIPGGLSMDFTRDAATGFAGVSAPGGRSPMAPRHINRAGEKYDPTWGWLLDPKNIGPINEKVNRAQQHTLLDTVGPMLVMGIAGLAAGGGGILQNLLTKGMGSLVTGQNPLQSIQNMLKGRRP